MSGYFLIANGPDPNLDDMLMNYFATAFMTPFLNWLVGGSFMTFEVLMGRVAVIDSRELPWWPRESQDSHDEVFVGRRWWMTPSDIVLKPSYYHQTHTWGEFFMSFLQRIGTHQLRSAPWIFFSIGITVPLFYVYSLLYYGNDGFNNFPQPQILTGIQAAIISLLTIPIWARIVLANLGSKMVHDGGYLDYMNEIDLTGDNIA